MVSFAGELEHTFNSLQVSSSSKVWDSLVLAAQHGDVDNLERLLNKNPETVNEKGFSGKTLLIFAAEAESNRASNCGKYDSIYGDRYVVNKSKDFRDTVELLLKKGAFINALDEGERTVLNAMDFVKINSDTENGKKFLASRNFLLKNGAKSGLEIQSKFIGISSFPI